MVEPLAASSDVWGAGADVAILEFLKRLGFDPKVIYDVGASNGSWTLPVSRVFPEARYELFEPLADCNEAYQWGLQQVARTVNSRLHRCALSNGAGAATFKIMGERGEGSSLLGDAPGAREIEVELRRLDDMVDSGVLAAPDMIKMDIQGGELKALRGGQDACLPHVSVLALELWMFRGYGADTPLMVEVAEYLRREHFFPFEIGDEYRTPHGRLATKDVWFVRGDSDIARAIWGPYAEVP